MYSVTALCVLSCYYTYYHFYTFVLVSSGRELIFLLVAVVFWI